MHYVFGLTARLSVSLSVNIFLCRDISLLRGFKRNLPQIFSTLLGRAELFQGQKSKFEVVGTPPMEIL